MVLTTAISGGQSVDCLFILSVHGIDNSHLADCVLFVLLYHLYMVLTTAISGGQSVDCLFILSVHGIDNSHIWRTVC